MLDADQIATLKVEYAITTSNRDELGDAMASAEPPCIDSARHSNHVRLPRRAPPLVRQLQTGPAAGEVRKPHQKPAVAPHSTA